MNQCSTQKLEVWYPTTIQTECYTTTPLKTSSAAKALSNESQGIAIREAWGTKKEKKEITLLLSVRQTERRFVCAAETLCCHQNRLALTGTKHIGAPLSLAVSAEQNKMLSSSGEEEAVISSLWWVPWPQSGFAFSAGWFNYNSEVQCYR